MFRFVICRKHDYENYLISAFYPKEARPAHVAVRAFNLEIAMVRENVSNPHIGSMRMQFWRETIDGVFKVRYEMCLSFALLYFFELSFFFSLNFLFDSNYKLILLLVVMILVAFTPCLTITMLGSKLFKTYIKHTVFLTFRVIRQDTQLLWFLATSWSVPDCHPCFSRESLTKE